MRTKPFNIQIMGRVDGFGTRRSFSKAGLEYARFSIDIDPSFDGATGINFNPSVHVFWFDAEEWIHQAKQGDSLLVCGTLTVRKYQEGRVYIQIKSHGKESVGYDGAIYPTVARIYTKKKRAGKARLKGGEIKV